MAKGELSFDADVAGLGPFWCRNVARVLTINDMFTNATALNQNLGSWYGSQVHNHHK